MFIRVNPWRQISFLRTAAYTAIVVSLALLPPCFPSGPASNRTSTPLWIERVTITDTLLIGPIDYVVAGGLSVGTVVLTRKGVNWLSDNADQEHCQKNEYCNRSRESHNYLLRLRCGRNCEDNFDLREADEDIRARRKVSTRIYVTSLGSASVLRIYAEGVRQFQPSGWSAATTLG